ncbi:hypothetical protein CW751_06650 [Brumimicrobium salinarum]|uniref:Secretion system C-terminal sorting domain-containing protein n=1 Tax=Brumimicrobium salinarum TaxID=2058658 RepID=A0A2I0R3W0_9FLAO|nr:T9SS type A sorting domain-containing protein [Brumimicrobium salinarum]PKR81258.1 hypothetical protein CW751_06650 [Brumimicrobium salinarum]
MKKLILGLLLLVGFNGWGQKDTLEYTTAREVADVVFGLLDAELYGNALFDRSLSEHELLIKQIKGDYSGIADAYSWLQAYSDIGVSYTNPKYMLPDTLLINKITNSYLQYQRESEEEKVIQPFGLLLHEMSKIDSNLYQKQNAFSNQRSQLKLNPAFDEKQIYSKVMFKDAALLELYGKHGYEGGIIKYNRDFISTGPNIKLLSIQLDVGNGFQEFSEKNNKINYRIVKDRQVGRAAVNYSLNGRNQNDTLSFYLTTEIYKYKNQGGYQEKSVNRWDKKNIKYPSDNHDIKYAIKYGCGNSNKIRRPVIIAPPYRPSIQNVSFRKYYDQFDFKSLISSLSEMGYDVIFIKQTPGNRGIDHAGGILAGFVKHINQKKKENFPNENWENIAIGFSAGGQHWRWALKVLEKEHMEWGTPHHHTRLYIPFDSPHWGANVPMFAQAVYYEFNRTWNPIAAAVYDNLKDAASRSMLINHIAGSTISSSNSDRIIYPAPDVIRQNLMNNLENSFNHQFTPINDLRRTFPTFTRNVAVSTGHNSADYNDEFGLSPGEKLFTQNYPIPAFIGWKHINRRINASREGTASSVFKRREIRMAAFIVPILLHRHYKTNGAYEWDMAQGGYKNEFYDQWWFPVSPIVILRTTGLFLGTKHYNGNMNFLPMVSALGINPTIWENDDLYYNLKDEGLMYNEFNFDINFPSNTYGYPNLAHPNTHFDITPFEAIYCDPQTYQHIKMQESVDDDDLDDTYLVHTRNFILDEVEADIVYLQNKTIGKNHIQWAPNYRYKAWYKAYDKVIIGDTITPKTNLGPFIIEKTGEVNAYACNGVVMKPGFHTQQGSKYHAFVHCDGCSRPREQGMKTNNGQHNEKRADEKQLMQAEDDNTNDEARQKTVLKVYPNPSDKGFTIEFPEPEGSYIITDTNGKIIKENRVLSQTVFIELPKGIYFLKWMSSNGVQTKKIIAL